MFGYCSVLKACHSNTNNGIVAVASAETFDQIDRNKGATLKLLTRQIHSMERYSEIAELRRIG